MNVQPTMIATSEYAIKKFNAMVVIFISLKNLGDSAKIACSSERNAIARDTMQLWTIKSLK
jgi:hypothetical protein